MSEERKTIFDFEDKFSVESPFDNWQNTNNSSDELTEAFSENRAYTKEEEEGKSGFVRPVPANFEPKTSGFKSYHGGADVQLVTQMINNVKTGVQFNVSGDIYIYSDDPFVLAANRLTNLAPTIQNQINNWWNNQGAGNFTANEYYTTNNVLTLPVVFNMTVQVLDNVTQDTINTLMSDGLRAKRNAVFIHINNSPNDGRQTILNSWSQGNMGSWSINGMRGVYAHEFGHLCAYWRWDPQTQSFPNSAAGNHDPNSNVSIMAAAPNFAQRMVTQADVDGLNFSFGLGQTCKPWTIPFPRKDWFPMKWVIIDESNDLLTMGWKTIGLRQKAILMTRDNYFTIPNSLPLW